MLVELSARPKENPIQPDPRKQYRVVFAKKSVPPLRQELLTTAIKMEKGLLDGTQDEVTSMMSAAEKLPIYSHKAQIAIAYITVAERDAIAALPLKLILQNRINIERLYNLEVAVNQITHTFNLSVEGNNFFMEPQLVKRVIGFLAGLK